MNSSNYWLDRLDEERMRSVLVSNIPPSTSTKEVLIHFIKGAGDVDSVSFPNPEDASTAFVTFEDPKTVETVVNCTELVFKGKILTVQRCSVVQRPPPEVFSMLTPARLNTDDLDCTKIAAVTYQAIPIVCEFLTTVSTCRTKLRVIEVKFSVDMKSIEDNTKVQILPKSGCTLDKYAAACEEYIKLYQDTLQNSMHREVVVLGSETVIIAPSEAVDQVTKQLPVLAIKDGRPDYWLFYGEKNVVEVAKIMAFKAVGIEDRNRRKRRCTTTNQTEP